MGKRTGQPVGRPRGRVYGEQRPIRMRPEDCRRMAALAARWGVSQAEAVRRSLKEAAEREGIGDA